MRQNNFYMLKTKVTRTGTVINLIYLALPFDDTLFTQLQKNLPACKKCIFNCL